MILSDCIPTVVSSVYFKMIFESDNFDPKKACEVGECHDTVITLHLNMSHSQGCSRDCQKINAQNVSTARGCNCKASLPWMEFVIYIMRTVSTWTGLSKLLNKYSNLRQDNSC
jgi:hypothetical protein